MIHSAYNNTKENDKRGLLLVITSDASGGTKGKCGIASMLRYITYPDDDHNHDVCTVVTRRTSLATTNVNPSKKKRGGTPKKGSKQKGSNSKRRSGGGGTRHIAASEIASIALGIRAALLQLQQQQQQISLNVLLLTDCEAAISFYCGNELTNTATSSSNLASSMQQMQSYWKDVEKLKLLLSSTNKNDGTMFVAK
eukprot:4425815-Ditylum_brightwellii.AAC.1